MTTPSLADLRRLFFGGGSAAEYAYLQSANATGVTAATLLSSAGYNKIAEQTLANPAAGIDVQNIPNTYKGLRVEASLRGDSAAAFVGISLAINGDVADANYYAQRIQGSAAAASAAETLAAAGSRSPGLVPAATATANLFGTLILEIPDYSATDRNKNIKADNYAFWGVATGTGIFRTTLHSWRNNAAIDRIQVLANAGNLIAGSKLSVYGIKPGF